VKKARRGKNRMSSQKKKKCREIDDSFKGQSLGTENVQTDEKVGVNLL
jgi:hypothetical protein